MVEIIPWLGLHLDGGELIEFKTGKKESKEERVWGMP